MEESSPLKISSDSRNFTEEHDGPTINKLQDTQAIDYSQMPNDNSRHLQTGQKKENEKSTSDNCENQEYEQKQLETGRNFFLAPFIILFKNYLLWSYKLTLNNHQFIVATLEM